MYRRSAGGGPVGTRRDRVSGLAGQGLCIAVIVGERDLYLDGFALLVVSEGVSGADGVLKVGVVCHPLVGVAHAGQTVLIGNR